MLGFSYLEADSWRAEALDGLRCDLGPITTKQKALGVFITFPAVLGRLKAIPEPIPETRTLFLRVPVTRKFLRDRALLYLLRLKVKFRLPGG